MTIQDTLSAILSAHGQHDSSEQARNSFSRPQWVRLGDEAIRTATNETRADIAHCVKLALDDPYNGGRAEARDFVIMPELNAALGETWYRAFMLPGDAHTPAAGNGKPFDCGLCGRDPNVVRSRVIGLYVAREIQMPEAA